MVNKGAFSKTASFVKRILKCKVGVPKKRGTGEILLSSSKGKHFLHKVFRIVFVNIRQKNKNIFLKQL